MLYNYFGSKQGLYAASIQRSGSALLTSMREADSRDAPAAQRLHAGILAFLTYAEEHRAGWTILHRETLAQGGLVAEELSGLRARVTEMLTTLFGDEALRARVRRSRRIRHRLVARPPRTAKGADREHPHGDRTVRTRPPGQ